MYILSKNFLFDDNNSCFNVTTFNCEGWKDIEMFANNYFNLCSSCLVNNLYYYWLCIDKITMNSVP